MSTPTTTVNPTTSSGNSSEVITLCSRHSSFLPLSLSRYRSRWFITYPRIYGMAEPGQRILCSLNLPDASSPDDRGKQYFWLNPIMQNHPYDPSDPDYPTKKFPSSPIHLLLDSEVPVARLTGRTRAEKSQALEDLGREIECFEVEVTIPEEGLLRQCWYCLNWEAEGPFERMKPCGSDAFWCSSCQVKGWAVANMERIQRSLPVLGRMLPWTDSLYS
ncbi:hypothetical protein L218DRAFT_953476 [Marasmius fiardii PR-910]|nr:hypothetical protein L218DRAFT_953476 [Marasmius fiardii PR-910]